MADNRPGYYAIIPAEVRYDERLSASTKLLYGEITALAGKEGYCYASNQYFARQYGVSLEHISRMLSRLEQAGHIRRTVERDGRQQVVSRKLYLTRPSPQKDQEGPCRKIKENNTRKNNNRKEEWL